MCFTITLMRESDLSLLNGRSALSHMDHHAFVCGDGPGEDGLRLGPQRGLIVITRGIVANEQTADMGIAGDGCSLARRTVAGLFGTGQKALVESGFVVEHVRPLQQGHKVGLIGRVGTVGIAARRVGGDDQIGVRVAIALGRHEVRPVLNLTDLCQRYVEVVHHVAPDMRLSSLLPEEKTRGGQTVMERQAYDL